MNKRITIREIAEKAGVTPSTVSRALNPDIPGKISDAVRKKIIRICDELEYRPNYTGRSIVTGKSFKIGMILGNMEEDFAALDWSRLICGLSDCLQKQSYTLLMLHAGTDEDRQKVCEFLMSGVADGYVTGPSMVTDNVRRLLERLHVPVGVVCESGQTSRVECCVQRDDMESFGQVWRSIPEKCLGKMVYIGSGAAESNRRFREILRAGKLAGMDAAEQYLEPIAFPRASRSPVMEYRDAFLAAEKFQKKLAGKTFFWCDSDFLALGLIDSLKKHGRTIGKDAFVVGYGDLESYPGVSVTPILSTIRASAAHLGELLGKQLLKQISGKKAGTVIAKTTFIQRKSFPKC